MDLGLLAELAILLALILANGILAGAEIAIVSLRASRVRELVAAGDVRARCIQRLRHKPERFLSTVQIGITVIGATAGALGGARFAADLAPLLEGLPGVGEHAPQVALVLAVSLISYFSVVLGELVPKSLALRSAERYARFVARPLDALAWVVQPAVRLLTGSSNLVLRLFGDHTSFTESRLSIRELQGLVDEASEAGSVPEGPGAIASRALQLADLTAADVMIHRRFVVSLPLSASQDELRRVLLDVGHRRTPVHGASTDDVLGYVSWRDVLRARWDGGAIDLAQLLRAAHFVPESTPAAELLETMRAGRLHLVFVADEHGGIAGIVTIEDLLEELVGEITSEHDAAVAMPIRTQLGGAALVAGTTPLRDVNRELDLQLDEEIAATIGGLATELAGGRIPLAGEHFVTPDGTRLEVVEASPRRVRSLLVHPPVRADEDESNDTARDEP